MRPPDVRVERNLSVPPGSGKYPRYHARWDDQGVGMDDERARELVASERLRTERLLTDLTADRQADRTAANQEGDMFDSAEPLTGQGADDAVVAELQGRLEALDRAQERIDSGTYGYSVRSGEPIPDDRLEADPAAELTVDEAQFEA
jgi:DnaK suppressor protein